VPPATSEFDAVFAALKAVFAKSARQLAVQTDEPSDYTLVTKVPSPFKQHKGHPMFFGSVRVGKAYVSLHLMPIYMCPELSKTISPELKKRMQGKACFNFKSTPSAELLSELTRLTEAALKRWREQKWA
jgi:hypothetical protein